MHKRRVVVDDNLGNVKSALQTQGYQVLSMNQISQNPDAIITSGMENNMMGMQDVQTTAPIISARGLSADQVIQELDQQLGHSNLCSG